MYNSQLPIIDLYDSIHEYQGEDIYTDLLEEWLGRNIEECDWVNEFRARTSGDWATATNEDLCRLYAFYRVTSLLLLRFQSGRADGTDYPGPAIEIEGFQLFHEQLGFQVFRVASYHPFYHEVLSVDQASSDDAPICIVECVRPCVMLGDMAYCRSGCAVSGGSSRIIKEIAESSQLYWACRRKDRPYNDQSQGWGHNSQWRTAQRRDYRSKNEYHYNIDGDQSLNDPSCSVDDISLNAMIELVRNRCMVKTKVNDLDLYPYCYTYIENA